MHQEPQLEFLNEKKKQSNALFTASCFIVLRIFWEATSVFCLDVHGRMLSCWI